MVLKQCKKSADKYHKYQLEMCLEVQNQSRNRKQKLNVRISLHLNKAQM